MGVSCRNLDSYVVYLYENGSESITSVGEDRDNFFCCCLPVITSSTFLVNADA